MFKGSTVMVTGGTGSFGRSFTKYILKKFKIRKLVIFSRDEMKQWEMKKLYADDSRVRFLLGDVRDKERLYRALSGVDYLVHAAATKIVTSAETDPFECVKTNINGAMNLVDAAIDQKVKKVVALSTDKASAPINLYGATKLVSDKLFIAANLYSGYQDTSFSIVRYGNVMGSRGSVIPLFMKQSKDGEITITDPKMTRFMTSLEQGISLVLKAFTDMQGGEIYVNKIPSMNILDIAKAIDPKAKLKFIGIRPGEKIHEQMISKDDARHTFEYKDHYKILPYLHEWSKKNFKIYRGKSVEENFVYASDTNKKWMKVSELRQWIANNKNYFVEI